MSEWIKAQLQLGGNCPSNSSINSCGFLSFTVSFFYFMLMYFILPRKNFNHMQSWIKLPFPKGLLCACHYAISFTHDVPNSYSLTGFIITISQVKEMCFKEFVHFSEVSQLWNHWAGSAFGHTSYLTTIDNLPISCIVPVYDCMCSFSSLELFTPPHPHFLCWRDLWFFWVHLLRGSSNITSFEVSSPYIASKKCHFLRLNALTLKMNQ